MLEYVGYDPTQSGIDMMGLVCLFQTGKKLCPTIFPVVCWAEKNVFMIFVFATAKRWAGSVCHSTYVEFHVVDG